VGDVPFHLKFALELTHPIKINNDNDVDANSLSINFICEKFAEISQFNATFNLLSELKSTTPAGKLIHGEITCSAKQSLLQNYRGGGSYNFTNRVIPK